MKLITIIDPGINPIELATICAADDAILLRQDASWLAARTDITWPVARVYVRQADVQLRQIKVDNGIAGITDQQWIEMTITAEQNLLW